MATANNSVKHIRFANVPIEKSHSEIENYSFLLTNFYPNTAVIIESSSHSKWLLTYANNIGL